jgi:hypothetical protein
MVRRNRLGGKDQAVDYELPGSNPIVLSTAFWNRCLQPKYFSDRYMSKEELDLFKLTSSLMTEPRTRSAQIMRSEPRDVTTGAERLISI